MNRLPRPGSKTERVAKKRLEFRGLILGEAPLTVADMLPVWKARRERRVLGRKRHESQNLWNTFSKADRRPLEVSYA